MRSLGSSPISVEQSSVTHGALLERNRSSSG
jgi:hypothetical protein